MVVIFIEYKKVLKELGYILKIANPRIDKDGNFRAVLFDKYDFDLHIKEYANNPKITSCNNFMAIAQNTPYVKNYYVIIPIKFKLEK